LYVYTAYTFTNLYMMYSEALLILPTTLQGQKQIQMNVFRL
jgi:hypothetical protein